MSSTNPSVINSPQDSSPGGGGPRVSMGEVRDVSRLRRSRDDRVIAGVAGGLGRHLDIDPLLIRIVLGVLTLFGGASIVAYLILWLAVPEDGAAESIWSRWRRADVGRVATVGVAIALIASAFVFLGSVHYFIPGGPGFLGVIVVALVALAVLVRSQRPHDGQAASGRHVPSDAAGGEPNQPLVSTESVRSVDATSEAEPSTDAPDDSTARTPLTTEARAGDTDTFTDAGAGTATATASGGTGNQPTRPVPTPPPRRPRSHLFAIAIALAAIALGVTGIYDIDHHVAPAVYPGIVLVASGLGLLVGSWFGRARLLIPVGIVAGVLTAMLSIVDHGPYGDISHRPMSAADVRTTYRMGAGDMVVDLRALKPADFTELDGRSITVDARVGQVEIWTPQGVDATIHADVDGGHLVGFPNGDMSGWNLDETYRSTDTDAPDLTIDVNLRFGEVDVHTGCASTTGGTNRVPACD
jgi:phage shock protein PspC (stress-responsive transcriptional regulator)